MFGSVLPATALATPYIKSDSGNRERRLLGSDSHTPAAGAIGMLAIGAGGLEVALAMAGQPFHVKMPRVWGVELTGSLPDWVSAKDVILEMLRRHNVSGGIGCVVEYHGPGLAGLSAMDRHVIANMGAELGATATVFPSDGEVHRFLKAQGREADWTELVADPDADYDVHEEIDLARLEPLIALPSSPGNVVPVREVAGREIYQAYVGSSANPGYRDFAVVGEIVKGKRVHDRVSFDVNPTSRQILENLVRDGYLLNLIHAGARVHQTGCNGCIGMGQAPATEKISLRTVPRNFPGRSGTREDKVYLVSPETAAASALAGVITDPRDLDMPYPRIADTDQPILNHQMLVPPLSADDARRVGLEKGPNIASLTEFDALPEELHLTVLLKVGDNISTDEIMPAGARALPFRSNIPKIAEFAFDMLDRTYCQRAKALEGTDGHAVVGGRNYGQGSSREHAALAPRYLGLRVVLARGFARIHEQNLVNFGIIPLEFVDSAEYDQLENGDLLVLKDLREKLQQGHILIENRTRGRSFEACHDLSPRQVQVVSVGGLINWVKHLAVLERASFSPARKL